MSLKLSREEWEQATGVRDEIIRLTARIAELEKALSGCVDDIIASHVFEGTPRFEAKRLPVVANAMVLLTKGAE